MKKIVLISSVFHPTNSPRANRATELAKEFGRQGHDVTVYALLGSYDYSEIETNYGIKVKNLGKNIYSNFNSDIDQINKRSLLTRIGSRLFSRVLEFPDIGVLNLVVSALKNEEDIDLLITIAVPYPIHWGAARFKTKYPKRMQHTIWVADCGDPFMGNPFHKRPFYFKYIEKWFCNKADYLSVPVMEAKEAYYPEFRSKIKVIPQGFNFDKLGINRVYKKNNIPTFVYAGTLYKGNRDPRPFLDFLVKYDKEFKFIVYTKTKNLLLEYKGILKDKLDIRDYVPREELIFEMSKADFLLNLENSTTAQSPSKLIDYALSLRPILSINTNTIMDESIIVQFLKGDYTSSLKIDNIEQYNIVNVVKSFESLISDTQDNSNYCK